MNYNQQKSSDKLWADESGTQIPYNRITKSERLNERSTVKVVKAALDVNKRLKSLNDLITELSEEAYEAYMLSKDIKKKSKGNWDWYNFDRSIKIEISVNQPIIFDSLTITAAKEKLDEFLDNQLSSKNEFVKAMVIEAFETSRGAIDTKKVMSLTKHENRVNNKLFSEAVLLINQAIRRPKSKTYRRVWIKDESGKYQNIELNLSSL
jgi:hypothetical protein